MSDPFADIDNEVYLEKFKKFFNKHKFFLLLFFILIFTVFIVITYINNKRTENTLKLSNYYVEILSIIEKDPERAEKELKKLSNLDKKNYKNLSNLMIFKVQYQNKNLEESLKTLKKIEGNVKNNSNFSKIIKYYFAQVYLDQQNKTNFDTVTNELLSFGGMWAMLSYELRGHYLFRIKNYEASLKNFNQIINNQQASNAVASRALEMIENINLYYEKLD